MGALTRIFRIPILPAIVSERPAMTSKPPSGSETFERALSLPTRSRHYACIDVAVAACLLAARVASAADAAKRLAQKIDLINQKTPAASKPHDSSLSTKGPYIGHRSHSAVMMRPSGWTESLSNWAFPTT